MNTTTTRKFVITSAVALMLATPALANDITQKTNAQKNAKQESGYQDVKAALLNDSKSGSFQTLIIDERQTASGMIGSTVYNTNGDAVGKVHDIILDETGRADRVIIADGEVFGMGKKVAFNYDVVTTRSLEGDVIAPITEDTIKRAVEFSYDRAETNKNVQVIPSTSRSVAKLLDANVLNDQNEKVGSVDNIAFKNGRASELIVGFDKVLGMGGKKAAIAYQDATLVRHGNGDSYDYKLDTQKTAQFNQYTRSTY